MFCCGTNYTVLVPYTFKSDDITSTGMLVPPKNDIVYSITNNNSLQILQGIMSAFKKGGRGTLFQTVNSHFRQTPRL